MTSENQPNHTHIVGVGMTPVAENWEKSLREIALEAITAARNDAGGLRPQALYVANMLAPTLSGQTQLGPLLADFAGLREIEALSVDAAGASGGMAVRQAHLAIASGVFDVVMVVGVEKATEQVSSAVSAALASASDADYETIHGITPAAQAGLIMRRYFHEHQAPAEALAGFSLNAHANAVANPYALLRRRIRPEDYAKAPMVSEPVSVMDSAPVADGAAALILARAGAALEDASHPSVRILASSASTSAAALHSQRDVLALGAAAEATRRAYESAGVGPQDIDLFELHDLFSIYAALALEAAGFAERGQGWQLAQQGAIALDGSIPVSCFGGSKARGDTAGATGVYQIVEVAMQLQQRAGENQVTGARIGMAQCLGGAGTTAVSHILTRAEVP
ncbi:MAG: thiolase domain-containing protein [Anaerolineales bacterium]|jgi:acetyl-CoA C-acetyltransferase